jgi:hypothetical protein
MAKTFGKAKCLSCAGDIPYNGKGRPAQFCAQCKSTVVSSTNVPASIAPPVGLKARPPEGVPPSVLDQGLPKLDELADKYDNFLAYTEDPNMDKQVLSTERRITLLARLIMESTLWDARGMTKKERYDAAVNAIRILEGSKSNIWVTKEKDEKLPRSQAEFFKAKEASERRMVELLKKYPAHTKELNDNATQVVEAERQLTTGEIGEA